MPHKITILASGTRGDIQPMIALALGLREVGITVQLAAPLSFDSWITSYQIPFIPFHDNPSELMMSEGGQSALTFDGHIIRSWRASAKYVQRARPMYARLLQQAFEICRGSSAVIISLPTVWGIHIAEVLNIPCIGAFTQPVSSTGNFSSPLIPSIFNGGMIINRLTYKIASLATFFPWRKQINAFRKSVSLKPVTAFDVFSSLDLILYGFSSSVIPRPADWTENANITGYWKLSEENKFSFPPALIDFIQADKPPLYFSFGSPGTRNPQHMLDMIVQAVGQTHKRAIVSIPLSLSSNNLPQNIYPLKDPIPHSWLFPQLAGIIHHGGAGTTAAALSAGVPMLITPLAVDQFFWGKRMEMLHMSPKPIPQRSLTMDNLIDALRKLEDTNLRKRAQLLSKLINAEDGVRAAVEIIKKNI